MTCAYTVPNKYYCIPVRSHANVLYEIIWREFIHFEYLLNFPMSIKMFLFSSRKPSNHSLSYMRMIEEIFRKLARKPFNNTVSQRSPTVLTHVVFRRRDLPVCIR